MRREERPRILEDDKGHYNQCYCKEVTLRSPAHPAPICLVELDFPLVEQRPVPVFLLISTAKNTRNTPGDSASAHSQ